MKRSIPFVGVVLVAASLLLLGSPAGMAGRVGDPLAAAGTAPAGQSMYFDVPFTAGEAIVMLNSSGNR